MSRLQGNYNVYCNGVCVGNLSADTVKLYTEFCCECSICDGGVMRLFVISGDRRVSLGIPTPEDGKLKLRRSFSQCELDSLGLFSIDSAFLEPAAQSGWTPENRPSGLFCKQIRSMCTDLPGTLKKDTGAGQIVAFPIDSALPFPLSAYFKRCTISEINGCSYLIFRLKNGELE